MHQTSQRKRSRRAGSLWALRCSSAPGSARAGVPLRLALMVLPASSLAGWPFTSGYLAKGGLKLHRLFERTERLVGRAESGLSGTGLLLLVVTAALWWQM